MYFLRDVRCFRVNKQVYVEEGGLLIDCDALVMKVRVINGYCIAG